MFLKALIVAFPKLPHTKKSDFVTDETYERVLARGRMRARFRAVGRELRDANLVCCFRAWRFRGSAGMWSATFGFLPRDACWARATLGLMCETMDAEVKNASRDDLAAHMGRVADQLVSAAESGNSKALYDGIKMVARRSTSCGPKRIGCADGMALLPFKERQQCFRSHFSKLLDDSVCQFADLVATARQVCQDRRPLFDVVERDVGAVPTFHEYAGRISRAKPRKAIGEDRIGPEIGKKLTRIVASAYHPIAVKAAVSLDPLVQWRGGMLLEFYEGKGPLADCTYYRDITLCDAVGKPYASCLRVCWAGARSDDVLVPIRLRAER